MLNIEKLIREPIKADASMRALIDISMKLQVFVYDEDFSFL